MLKWLGIFAIVCVGVGGALLYGAATGRLGDDEVAGTVVNRARPAKIIAERVSSQASTGRTLGANDSRT